MIVSDRGRFVFVHNPKAAGTSIRRHLAPFDDARPTFWKFGFSMRLGRRIDRAHIPLDDLARAYPREYGKLLDYKSFVFVRNPYARTRSAFMEWCVRTGQKRELARPGWAAPRFRDYVAALDAQTVRTSTRWIHACPQHQFVFRGSAQLCDRIGRAETFADDYADLAAWLGLGLDSAAPERHNDSGRRAAKGESRAFADWYDGETARRVAGFYAADFEMLGYDREAL